LTSWPIDSEDDVRDLLYVMLRASVSDIRIEEAVPSRAGTHKFVDIFSALGGLFIEVKWIKKRGSWKRVVREIHDDVQSYPRHPRCETIMFLVIDTVKDIPDPAQLERELTGKQTIDGKQIDVRAFVREP
jgi:hypothetical protein